MRIADLRSRLQALGAAPSHERRVLRHWVQAKAQDAGRRRLEDFMPARVRAALPELVVELAALARLSARHPGQDG